MGLRFEITASGIRTVLPVLRHSGQERCRVKLSYTVTQGPLYYMPRHAILTMEFVLLYCKYELFLIFACKIPPPPLNLCNKVWNT
jgi:hypothetical protein